MSDNSWYEKGELPTVGTPCIHKTYGKGFVIAKHYFDDEVIIFANHKDCGELHYANSTELRPIKTERELAIESALKVFNVGTETDKLLFTMAGALFDAGLLRSKNES